MLATEHGADAACVGFFRVCLAGVGLESVWTSCRWDCGSCIVLEPVFQKSGLAMRLQHALFYCDALVWSGS
jgi:hypothetical protein